MRPTRPTRAETRLSWRRAAAAYKIKKIKKNCNYKQFCRSYLHREEAAVCQSSLSYSKVTVSGQTVKRRRDSPLASEQMSESDWTAAPTLNRGSVTILANRRRRNLNEYLLWPMGADHAFAWYTPKEGWCAEGKYVCMKKNHTKDG